MGLLGLAGAECRGGRSEDATIRVDVAVSYQTISGWEASESFAWRSPKAAMDSLMSVTVNDLSINRLRLSFPGNMVESRDTVTMPNELREGTNDNADPHVLNPAGFRWELEDYLVETFVLPMKRRVEARGEPFILTATYVGSRTTSQYQQKDSAEYNEFMLAVLDHLKTKYGIVPDIWEIRLEPDHGRNQMTPRQQGILLAGAGAAVRAAGYDKLTFSVPSTAVPHRTVQYLQGILSSPGTAEYIGEIGFHQYSAPSSEMLTGIRDAAMKLGVPTGMMEYNKGTERELYQDLTPANVSVWSRFSLAGNVGGPDVGGQYFYVDVPDSSFRYRPSTWPLRQYFKYVRPGYVRVAAKADDDRVQPTAFRRPDGGVIVVANLADSATTRVRGLPAGRYLVTWASTAGRGDPGPPVTVGRGGILTMSIPRAATVTVSPADER
ncbi:MAG: hypothetical protein ABI679_00340 [Gemmatimonadota bacterium]